MTGIVRLVYASGSVFAPSNLIGVCTSDEEVERIKTEFRKEAARDVHFSVDKKLTDCLLEHPDNIL